jgi:hypothetical protein
MKIRIGLIAAVIGALGAGAFYLFAVHDDNSTTHRVDPSGC